MKSRRGRLLAAVVLLTLIVGSMFFASCSSTGKAPCPAYRRVSVQ